MSEVACTIRRIACELCDDTGFVITDGPKGTFAVACRACRMRETRSRPLARRRPGDPIPKRFRDPATEEHAMEELRATARTRVLAYQRDVVSRIAVGNGLWLYGESGTAKTVAAGLIARAAYETGHLVVFSSTVALLAQLKDDLLTESHFDRPSPFDLVENPDLLVLDDLDAAREEDWGLPYLATSLRRRAFRETRAMVVTSSCHPSELGPIVGWSTVRALKDVCGAAVNVDPEYEPPPPDAGVIRAARRARRAARSAI